jgi:hypothetical protein
MYYAGTAAIFAFHQNHFTRSCPLPWWTPTRPRSLAMAGNTGWLYIIHRHVTTRLALYTPKIHLWFIRFSPFIIFMKSYSLFPFLQLSTYAIYFQAHGEYPWQSNRPIVSVDKGNIKQNGNKHLQHSFINSSYSSLICIRWYIIYYSVSTIDVQDA